MMAIWMVMSQQPPRHLQAHAKAIFDGMDGTGTNVTAYLKNLLAPRFGVTDVPDAFIFAPGQLGGLGLLSPFTSLFLVREQVYRGPRDRMNEFFTRGREACLEAKNNLRSWANREDGACITASTSTMGARRAPRPGGQVGYAFTMDDYVQCECGSGWRTRSC